MLGRLVACRLPPAAALRAPHAAARRAHSVAAASASGQAAALHALLDSTLWTLRDASSAVTPLPLLHAHDAYAASLLCVRDDLLHPHIAGNKARKLDALLPQLVASGATDIVSCGGAQSAHAAAVAAACAAAGLRAHLLLRGEAPAVLTGHALVTRAFAHHVSYVSRDAYADRAALLADAAAALRRDGRAVGVIPEGGACAGGVLGTLRGLRAWAASGALDAHAPCLLVVDAGTGATAWALALGCALLELPWHVHAVPVAGHGADCVARCAALAAEWAAAHPALAAPAALPLAWAPPAPPPAARRRFGVVRRGDAAECAALARATGVLTDPVWTLHAYRAAAALAAAGEPRVAWVHTGGAAGALDAVAQRWPERVLTELRDDAK